MNILQLDRNTSYPPTNGAEVRSWKMTEKLTEYGDVWLASPWDDRPEPPGVTLVPLGTPLLSSELAAFELYYGAFALGDRNPLSRLVTDQVVRRVADRDVAFDLVVTESIQLVDAGAAIAREHGARLLVNKHNAYFDLFSQLIESRPVPGFVAERAVENCRRAEARGIAAADVVVFQSEGDAARFDVPEGTRSAVVPNGTDVDAVTADGDPARLARELGLRPDSPVCIFVGSFDYEANAAAARRIDREIAPSLPDAEFLLVGRAPPEPTAPNVRAPGFVDHLADAFALADVALCPLPFGSGTKLKMLDYLAAGLPIVTTTVGAQGLPIEDGREALVRDEADEMVAAIGGILADGDLRAHLASGARALGERYDWEDLLDRYDALLGVTADEPEAGPEPAPAGRAN